MTLGEFNDVSATHITGMSAEGVWVAVGYGAANATLIEGDTGAIIIDTMYGTEAAGHVLAATVRLPAHLAEKSYLQEYYGVLEWSVRSIYTGYLGWFDGIPTGLFPLAPRAEAERMIRLAGSRENLLETTREALETGDYQWACQLLDHLLVLTPDSKVLKQLKAGALRSLAASQQSSNARHYYLSSAEKLESR